MPRLGVHADGWVDTTLELPPGTWLDVLSDLGHAGGPQRLPDLWRRGSIALLVSQ